MKKRWRGIILTVVLLGIFAWYIAAHWQAFLSLQLVAPWLLLPTAMIVVISIYAIGALLALTIEPFGIKLKPFEVFGLSVLTRFCNYIAPGYLGAAVRAWYLKKNHRVSFAKFSASFLVSNIIQFLVSGLVALVIFIALREETSSQPLAPFLVLIIAVSLFLLSLWIPLGRVQRAVRHWHAKTKNKALERLNVALDGYVQIRAYPGLLSRMVAWALITLAASTGILFSLYYALGVSAAIIPVLFIAALGSWAIIFSITPANIGVREGLMAFGAYLVDIPVPETVAAALLLRLVTFVVVGLLALYFTPRLLNTPITKIAKFKG